MFSFVGRADGGGRASDGGWSGKFSDKTKHLLDLSHRPQSPPRGKNGTTVGVVVWARGGRSIALLGSRNLAPVEAISTSLGAFLAAAGGEDLAADHDPHGTAIQESRVRGISCSFQSTPDADTAGVENHDFLMSDHELAMSVLTVVQ